MAKLTGTEGHDVLQARADGGLLQGLGGNDALLSTDKVGSTGAHGFSDVSLQGGAGSDYLLTRGGSNSHQKGDTGNDILIADSSASTAANHLYGGAGGDDLQATAKANFYLYYNIFKEQTATNTLQGNSGDDVMTALGSAVSERAKATVVNMLTGGSGNDTMSATGSAAGDTGGGSGSVANKLDGGNGNDMIVASAAADGNPENNLSGGAGNDRLEAKCTLYVSAGQSTGVNHLQGGAGDDILLASFISDAGYGHSELYGGNGNDSLTVENGEGNVVEGGSGHDKLFGGAGSDRFDFRGLNGNDAIKGFVHGTDHIRISGYGAALDTFRDLHINIAGGDTHIDLSASVAGAGKIILHGVTHVDATDFVFV